LSRRTGLRRPGPCDRWARTARTLQRRRSDQIMSRSSSALPAWGTSSPKGLDLPQSVGYPEPPGCTPRSRWTVGMGSRTVSPSEAALFSSSSGTSAGSHTCRSSPWAVPTATSSTSSSTTRSPCGRTSKAAASRTGCVSCGRSSTRSGACGVRAASACGCRRPAPGWALATATKALYMAVVRTLADYPLAYLHLPDRDTFCTGDDLGYIDYASHADEHRLQQQVDRIV